MNYNYKTVYEYAIDKNFRDGAGKFNKYKHYHQSFTWKDTTIVTPNNDTPYSWAILELSTEPVVLSIPAMAPSDRYFCWQLVDMYTYNFAYIGTGQPGITEAII